MALTKEQMLNMKHGDVVNLVKWKNKDGEKVITVLTNALFNEFLDNGKASFKTFACRPKNCHIDQYGETWELRPTKTWIRNY